MAGLGCMFVIVTGNVVWIFFIKAFRVCVHFINLKKKNNPEVKSFAWSGFNFIFVFVFLFFFF